MSTAGTTSRTVVRIGRRPVHDRHMRVVAYELHSDHARARGATAGHDVHADLFLAGMVDVGLDRLASGHDVVVALPPALIHDGALAHLPIGRLVLDVRADQRVDDTLESLLRSAHSDGLRLRVDDPIGHPHLAGIAEVADMVAVDMTALGPTARRQRLGLLRAPGRRLLATGIDDHATHDDCRAAGFDLFSGTVLAVPNVVSGTRLGADRVSLFRLVTLLTDPDVRVDALEAAVTSNPVLSYQILRYVNSAFVGLRTQVDSIRQAIVLLGPPVLRQLSGLLLAHQITTKPLEAVRLALARAKMCATVGAAMGDSRSAHHTVGMLSAVDLLTDVPLGEAIAGLPLTEEVSDAVLHRTGRLGRVLQAVMRYERCDWDDPVLSSFDPGLMSEAYLSGLSWADGVLAAADEMG